MMGKVFINHKFHYGNIDPFGSITKNSHEKKEMRRDRKIAEFKYWNKLWVTLLKMKRQNAVIHMHTGR